MKKEQIKKELIKFGIYVINKVEKRKPNKDELIEINENINTYLQSIEQTEQPEERENKGFKFIEPELIKAGDTRILLGFDMKPPKVDCRLISEENYQFLTNKTKQCHNSKK